MGHVSTSPHLPSPPTPTLRDSMGRVRLLHGSLEGVGRLKTQNLITYSIFSLVQVMYSHAPPLQLLTSQ